jgi:phosphoglycerate dehydrogenase-like enzyme
MNVLVFISWPVQAWCIPGRQVEALRAAFPHVSFKYARDRDEALRLVGDADVSFTPFLTAEMVAAAPNLRWVHSSAAAVEGLLPLKQLAARGIAVTNSRGVQAIPIAEHVMGGLLVLARKYDRTLDAQREHRWIQNDLIHDWPWLLHGRTMTVVGLGTIGIEIARRAHAFGVRVTGVRRRTDEPRPDFVDRVVGPEQLGEALEGCDVLVLSAPGIASTHRMIGAEQLARLNPGAVVVNVARGQVLDTNALLDGLSSGRLRGAVLDVFEQEPLDASSPLWSAPNVVVTPHSSGFRESHWDEMVALFSDNLRRYERGEPLRNVVDLDAGY